MQRAKPGISWSALATILLVVAACTSAGSQGTSPDPAGQTQGPPEDVTFALNWLPLAEATGWYAALDQGYFTEENLNVEIVRGFGSGDTVKRIALGEAEIGVADFAALLPLVLNEDVPVVAVAAFYAKPPHGVFFRAGEGINEPKDLEGKSISCSANNANLLLFPAFAAAAGFDADAVEFKLGDPGGVSAAFASGQTDAVCEFINSLPIIEAQVDGEVDGFLYADHGVSGYAHVIFVTRQMAEEKPDMVRRFVRAAMRGVGYAIENPDDAVENLLSYAPDNDPAVTKAAWKAILDAGVLRNDDTEQHGLGYIDAARMKATFDALVEASDLDPGTYKPEDLYTTEFISR